MSDLKTYQDALTSLDQVHRLLKNTGSDDKPAIEAVDTYLLLHVGAVTFAAGLAVCEIVAGFAGHSMTERLLMMTQSSFADARLQLVKNTGVILFVLCVIAYGLILLRAKQESLPFTEYNKRHFDYFKNFAACSDLTIKYLIVALLILAGKPEWVAGVSTLLIADAVLQARILVIPAKTALFTGLVFFAVGCAMLIYGTSSLLWPLLLAATVTGWSLGLLSRLRHRLIAAG